MFGKLEIRNYSMCINSNLLRNKLIRNGNIMCKEERGIFMYDFSTALGGILGVLYPSLVFGVIIYILSLAIKALRIHIKNILKASHNSLYIK